MAAERLNHFANPQFSAEVMAPPYPPTGATLYRPVNGDWEAKQLSNVRTLPVPAIALDSDAHPHVAYEALVAVGAGRTLRHV